MKKQTLLISILTIPCLLFAEIESPEFINSKRAMNPEKQQLDNIQTMLHQKAEKNYRNKFFADTRQEKYLNRARQLSKKTQELLTSPKTHKSSTPEDIERLTQEIAREKQLKSKLWFNSEKSGTLIKDLETLKNELQQKHYETASPEAKDKLNSNTNPAETYFKSHDIGAQIEKNPLSPKHNFDYDEWKKTLLEKQENIQKEQQEVNKKISTLKKQEKYQQDQILNLEDQRKEIFKDFSKKTLSPEYINYVATEIVKHQTKVYNIKQERLKDFKFKTFGIHEDNEKAQELKTQINVWKQELQAYDRLQALNDQEQTIRKKIQTLQDQQDEHTKKLKALDEELYDTKSSINNADFHLKRISKYLNSLA